MIEKLKILEKVKEDCYNLTSFSHSFGYLKEKIVYELETQIRVEQSYIDDGIQMPPYRDSDFSINENSFRIKFSGNCQKCGKHIHSIVVSEDKELQFFEIEKATYQYMLSECSFQNKEFFEESIYLNGNIQFVNFFKDPEKNLEVPDPYGSHSLESLSGLKNLTKFYSENNVIFGQTGNTSGNVFVNPEKNHIIISQYDVEKDAYEESLANFLDDFLEEFGEEFGNSKSDEYADRFIRLKKVKEMLDFIESNNYEYIGYISMDMWRYMGADKETIEKLKLTPVLNMDDGKSLSIDGIQAGFWDFKNIVEFDDESDNIIFGELKFKYS